MDPLFFQALGDRVNLDPASLSQDCWQEKSGPASVLVTRFSREEALMSGQGFILLLMLQKILSSSHHSLLDPSPQLYLCLVGFLARAEKLELEEKGGGTGAGKAPKNVGTKCQAGNCPALSPTPQAPGGLLLSLSLCFHRNKMKRLD